MESREVYEIKLEGGPAGSRELWVLALTPERAISKLRKSKLMDRKEKIVGIENIGTVDVL